ncbi:MAG: hypothetical protein K5762_04075 [Bacilli bacterium]|nr:hypothetical protein [Bacilli bacterium]
MIIDLHCHTIKAKIGDYGRDVDSDTFKTKIEENNVGVVAITNHNLFSLSQYKEFSEKCDKTLILPGVELDVEGDKSGVASHGHVIVIVDVNQAEKFNVFIAKLTNGSTPDNFAISIDDLVSNLNNFNRSIVIFHYHKTPCLSNDDIKFFKDNSKNSIAVLEPSNARKAGIVANFEKAVSWFGSDNHKWINYPEKELPDCLFKITSFNSLFELLSKNQNAILLKSLMSPKGPTPYQIQPFSDLNLTINLFNDVNIIFGSKATGKTEILKSLEKKLIASGKSVSSFYIEKKSKRIEDFSKQSPSEADLSAFKDYYCEQEFEKINNWKWTKIPTLKNFYDYATLSENNNVIEKLKISSSSFTECLLEEVVNDEKKKTQESQNDISKVLELNKDGLSKTEENQLNSLLIKLYNTYCDSYYECLFDFESKRLEKLTIEFFSREISKSQNIPNKPLSVGLNQVFIDSYNLKTCLSKIAQNLDKSLETQGKPLGHLQDKRMVCLKSFIGFRPQEKSSNSMMASRQYIDSSANVTSFKEFEKQIKSLIKGDITTKEYMSTLGELKEKIFKGINSLKYFLNYTNKFICGNNQDFKPSNGEVSILMVDSVLHDNSDVIILDEPDSGMGEDYINDVLLPDIIDAAKRNKSVVISTHDANLVVRTHPYLCIFRDKDNNEEFKTYIGNSFEDLMINPNNDKDTVWWVDKCISKCEGGLDAISERINTYGKY